MSKAFRNLFIALAALLIAVVTAGLAQGGFEALLPGVGQRMIGATDLSTYFVVVALGLVFFCVGYIVPRWLKTSMPLLWLAVPLVGLYLCALLAFPAVYSCIPGRITGCWVVHLPFLVSACALIAGFFLGSAGRWSRHAT